MLNNTRCWAFLAFLLSRCAACLFDPQ